MNFQFKNSTGANELISQLRLGQIIKVKVLQKTGTGQYLIGFRDLTLTAVSEIDLMSKQCWLKVQQLTPFPKLQLIVEESNGSINELFQYADENGLILPQIPQRLSELLPTIAANNNPKDLYDFLLWYAQCQSWSALCELYLAHQHPQGIPLADIISVYNDQSIIRHDIAQANILSAHIIISSKESICGVSADKIALIEKINASINVPDLKLALLHIQSPFLTITLPVECQSQSIVGLLRTDYLGNVELLSTPAKPFTPNVKEGHSTVGGTLTFTFETSLYLNAVLKTLPIPQKDTPLKGNILKLTTPTTEPLPLANIIIKIIEKDIELQ